MADLHQNNDSCQLPLSVGKKKAIKKAKLKEKKVEARVEPEIEKPFDFGGLPDKNMKKNLGCG